MVTEMLKSVQMGNNQYLLIAASDVISKTVIHYEFLRNIENMETVVESPFPGEARKSNKIVSCLQEIMKSRRKAVVVTLTKMTETILCSIFHELEMGRE
jgi:hypothetical protein